MTESELLALEEIDTPHGKWWVPFVWCCNLCRDALQEGRISDGYLFTQVIQVSGNSFFIYIFSVIIIF